MKLSKGLSWIGLVLLLLTVIPSTVMAQRGGPQLEVVLPPMEFETSEEHYAYLLEQANGGTEHTMETVPQWSGLWQPAGTTRNQIFLDQGEIREGVLTPAYEQQFRETREIVAERGTTYDRITQCEAPGYPRYLGQAYTHEFINLPDQTWQINDVGNGIRRIYIGAEHSNVYGTHSWYGDIIGFWDGDRLITNTVDLLPAGYTRNQPLTSNQFESVEIWELKNNPDGTLRLEVQATFYDSFALQKPIHAVFAFRQGTAIEEAGHRVLHWECIGATNARQDADGSTGFFLPGEEGYVDVRGSGLFPDLPGQSRDPIYNTELPTN